MTADVLSTAAPFMWLANCPPAGEGESTLGYIWRASFISGYSRQKGLIEEMNGRTALQPPWTVPSGLARICAAFRPVFASPQAIIAQHTCLPAHLPFVSAANQLHLLSHAIGDEVEPGIAALVGLSGRAVRSKPVMALCLLCIEQDRRALGYEYWHREHCLAGLGYCPRHGVPLVAGCGSCRFSHRLGRAPRLPSTRCWCGGKHVLSHPTLPASDVPVMLRVVSLAQELLDGKMPNVTTELLGVHYYLRARQMGYAAGGYLQTGRLMADVRKRYSPTILTRLNAEMAGPQNWLSAMLGKRTATNVLGRNLLLLDFLGGELPSAQDLTLARQALPALEEERKRTPCGTQACKTSEPSKCAADRQVIEEFVASHPTATRSAAFKRLGRVLVRARRRDSEWLAKVLPAAPRRNATKSPEQGEAYWRAMDVRMATHISVRHRELLSSKNHFGKKLTKRVLLTGFPCSNEVSEGWLKRLPLASAALLRCVETSFEHKKFLATRVMCAHIDEPNVLSLVKSITGLPAWLVRDLFQSVQAESR